MRTFFKNLVMAKDNGDKAIVVEVGLAVIGVALLIVFRTAITNLVQSLIFEATSNIRSLFN